MSDSRTSEKCEHEWVATGEPRDRAQICLKCGTPRTLPSKPVFKAVTTCALCGRRDWEHTGIECYCPSGPLPQSDGVLPDAGLIRSALFQQFMHQGFWHAHHVDLVWRYNGQDVREEADWLKDVWYALRRTSSETPQPMTPADRAMKGTIRAYIIAALADHGMHATDSFKDELADAIFRFVRELSPTETPQPASNPLSLRTAMTENSGGGSTPMLKIMFRTTAEMAAAADQIRALGASPETPQPSPDIFDWSKPTGGYMAETPQPDSNDGLSRIREHDFPILLEFHSKHALPALMRPSCLVCGRVPEEWPPAIQHAELPAIVVCHPCRDRATHETPAPQTNLAWRICSAYEHGFGQASRDISNPYSPDTLEGQGWEIGRSEGKRRQNSAAGDELNGESNPRAGASVGQPSPAVGAAQETTSPQTAETKLQPRIDIVARRMAIWAMQGCNYHDDKDFRRVVDDVLVMTDTRRSTQENFSPRTHYFDDSTGRMHPIRNCDTETTQQHGYGCGGYTHPWESLAQETGPVADHCEKHGVVRFFAGGCPECYREKHALKAREGQS